MKRSNVVPERGTFKYGSICCGLAWGKSLPVIAKITTTTVAVVKAVQRDRHRRLATYETRR